MKSLLKCNSGILTLLKELISQKYLSEHFLSQKFFIGFTHIKMDRVKGLSKRVGDALT